jgi:hypothetical protein
MPEPAYKRCSRCGEEKPLGEFHKSAKSTDGAAWNCKDCQREYAKKWAQDNPERVTENRVRWRAENPDRVRELAQRNPERRSATAARWRQENRERKKATDEQWEADNPERLAAKRDRLRAAYPEKYEARTAVAAALNRGDLVRPKICETCHGPGQPYADGRAPIQAHHPDYSQPLDVEWLCRDCHGARHHDQPD